MTIEELEKIMIKYGIVVRAIPRYEYGTIDTQHKSQYPESIEYFDPRFNRNMLRIKKENHYAGKFMIVKNIDTCAIVPFYKPKYFDSIEEAIKWIVSEIDSETESRRIE